MMFQKCILFLTLMLRGNFHLRSALTFNPDFTKLDRTIGRRFCQTPLKKTYTLYSCSYRTWWVLSKVSYRWWFLSSAFFNRRHFAGLDHDKHWNINLAALTIPIYTYYMHIAHYKWQNALLIGDEILFIWCVVCV